MHDSRRSSLASRVGVETASALVAVAATLVVLAVLLGSERSWLLLYDGDSVLPLLLRGSLAEGAAQNWSLSAVLFVPEGLAFLALSTLGLGAPGTLLLAAAANLLALYAALRWVAQSVRTVRSHPAYAAVAAFCVFVAMAALESGSARNDLELASLLATTTYYSATVIATIAVVALCVRMAPGPGAARSRTAVLAGAAVVALVSTFSNPLFLVWAAAPAAIVLAALWFGGRLALRPAAAFVAALAIGGAVGLLARLPFGSLTGESATNKIRSDRVGESWAFLGRLIAERSAAPGGAVELAIVVVLLAWCVVGTVLSARRRATRPLVVTTLGWVIPLVSVVVAVASGTEAARYLQPVFFAPVLGLLVLPTLVRRSQAPHGSRRGLSGRGLSGRGLSGWGLRTAGGVTIVVAVLAVAVAAPPLIASATHVDESVRCVDRWVEASGRTGAGQFWTIRAPKAYLARPSALIQVDSSLHGYAWLVNRSDFATRRVSFLVTDDQSPAFELPDSIAGLTPTVVRCGRYTISDYGDPVISIGRVHR